VELEKVERKARGKRANGAMKITNVQVVRSARKYILGS